MIQSPSGKVLWFLLWWLTEVLQLVWFVQTACDGTVHHGAWGKWYESRSHKLSSLVLQLRHSPTFPKGSAVGTVVQLAQKALSRHCNGPFDMSPDHWYSLFCRVSNYPPLSQTRWDPDDSLIVFVGRLNQREHVQRTVSE